MGWLNWIRGHPFWTLLILLALFVLFQFLLSFGGSGSGGLDG